MEYVSGARLLTLAVIICSGFVVTAMGTPKQNEDRPSPEAQESLKNYLRTVDDDTGTRFVAAFRDLNADGVAEAIVHLIGTKWCGSGGCNTLVLTPHGTTWRSVANIRISRPPIYVLRDMSHGWHSIGVWVQGGGSRGHEAELRFDGKTYPENPSLPPARPLDREPEGEEVIPSTQNARFLYDGQG